MPIALRAKDIEKYLADKPLHRKKEKRVKVKSPGKRMQDGEDLLSKNYNPLSFY